MTALAPIEKLEAAMLPGPRFEPPPTHRFEPGVYLREVRLPAGWLGIGHQHTTEHMNVILCGRALIVADGQPREIVGPCAFVSQPGVRKAVYVYEEMVWQTLHATEETDLEKLESQLIVKSKSFQAFNAEVQRLKALVCHTSP